MRIKYDHKNKAHRKAVIKQIENSINGQAIAHRCFRLIDQWNWKHVSREHAKRYLIRLLAVVRAANKKQETEVMKIFYRIYGADEEICEKADAMDEVVELKLRGQDDEIDDFEPIVLSDEPDGWEDECK